MSLDGRPAGTTPTLPDAAARAIVTGELGRTLFVEAGAGSGKTSSLVARIVALVESGVPIESIAAITFTEAAASELRHRVRDALLERSKPGQAASDLDSRARAAKSKILLDAAAGVETAPITTLHGFALRLLMQHPVEAGLPPGFDVVDEINSILDFDDAWRALVGLIGDDLSLLDLQSRASVLRLELRHFPEVARRFDDNWDLLEGVDLHPLPLSEIDFSDLFAELEAVVALADACNDESDKLCIALGELGEAVAKIVTQEPLDQMELLNNLVWPRRSIGRKGSWSDPSVDDVRNQVEAVRGLVADHMKDLGNEVLQHYVALVADFVTQRVAARQELGELSFHDLLVLARRLLRSDAKVRLRLHQQYSRLLLDEFQDTDPIQIELAVLLASDQPVENRTWQELAPELPEGRLVVVGDPKQSIYRFRRADIRVYGESEQALVSESVQLTTNFRSVPGIVHFVNHVFGEVMGDGVEGEQPAYTPLDVFREPDPEGVRGHWMAETGDGPPVVVLGGPSEATAIEVRQQEATDIAAFICRVVNGEQKVQRDGQWLPARLQDVAILIPSRLSLPALESALTSAGLPFRPETSSLVYATQEVRDVLAGVRAAVDPSSSVDVVAALRSSLFAVDDDELLRWSLAGGSWDYRVIVPDTMEAGGIAAAFAVLNQWHDDRWWSEPSQMVDRIIRERRLREQSLAASRPRDRWRRYRFLAEQARQFATLQGGDLHDFVRWVEIQSSDLARVTEPIPSEPDDDAVRILTVHGSKGLEFPITVLAGASTLERARNTGPSVLFEADGRPQVKLGKDRATTGFDVHASIEEILDEHERARLHYVAATRARDVLVVSAYHLEGRASMGRRTHEQLASRPDLWQRFTANGDEAFETQTPTQLRLGAGDYERELEIWRQEHVRVLEANRRATVESATGVARRAGREEPTGDEPDHEKRPWRRGRAGTAIGSAVHAVLQHVDLASGEGLAGLARLHAEREGIAHLSDRVEALASSALQAPTVKLAAAGRSWRELHVAVPLGLDPEQGVLEGYVDLLLEVPGGLIVADFKTDPLHSEADADRLLETYRLQGAAYAVALGQITGRPIVDCRFIFLSSDGVTERSVSDLPGAMAEVRQLLS